MRRTTLALEDGLLRAMRLRAAREGRSLTAVANDLLRRGIAQAEASQARSAIAWKTHRCEEVYADTRSRDALYSVMER